MSAVELRPFQSCSSSRLYSGWRGGAMPSGSAGLNSMLRKRREKLHWGSRSNAKAFSPCRAKYSDINRATVVLPTPPLFCTTASTLICISPLRKTLYNIFNKRIQHNEMLADKPVLKGGSCDAKKGYIVSEGSAPSGCDGTGCQSFSGTR